jgi:hypothetical protein
MNRAYTSIIALTLAAFGASQAIAADAPKTREQVRAEAAAALAAGDFIVENGQKANELYPGLYKSKKPAAAASAPAKSDSKTREQVKAEAAKAAAAGDFIVESGQKANELYPGLYNSNKPTATAKARDDVKAELRDAVRNGEMLAYGETTVTVKDVFPGNYRAQ